MEAPGYYGLDNATQMHPQLPTTELDTVQQQEGCRLRRHHLYPTTVN
jgi:hypothetical protein